MLAFLTGSILPSLMLHFVGDMVLFALRYAAARGGASAGPETGTISVAALFAFAAFAAVSVSAFRQLARETRGPSSIRSIPAMG
jgi:hypothetical protein